MSLSKIYSKVFGEQILNESLNNENDRNSFTNQPDPPLIEQIRLVRLWLDRKLQVTGENCENIISQHESQNSSRLGPEKVMFDTYESSTIRISCDRLSIRSHGSFNTIKANVCVFEGKWMYEVQLHSKGVMQIGWCSNNCTFNENSGVGDTVHSYGYDGSKQQKWHMSSNKYGEIWQIGDIIGVCLDINKSIIEYYRNGVSMGIAFKNIEKGPGIVFFPAVSLGYREGLKANFGNSPHRFPVSDYNTLQIKPFIKLEKAELLLRYTINLAGIISRPKYKEKEKKTQDGRFSTKKIIHVLLSSLVIEYLAKNILDPYVIEEIFLPYIMHLCVVSSDVHKGNALLSASLDSTLGTFLNMLWNYLQYDEMSFVMKQLLNILLSRFSQTAQGLENETQCKVIFVLNSLCAHPITRKFYLENKLFKKHCLAILMYLRPPEYSAMIKVLPDDIVWTKGIGGSKEEYSLASNSLAKSVDALYTLQINFLRTLLTNTDGDSSFPSSRKIFTNKLRRYVIDASMEQKPLQSLFLMQSSIHHPIESPVALSFLCILLNVFQQLLREETTCPSLAIDPKLFFDGTLEYQHFDRVGGVLSHLYKVHRNELANEIGNDRVTALSHQESNFIYSSDMDTSILITPANLNSSSIHGQTARNTTAGVSHILYNSHQMENPNPGNAATIQSLYELLDIGTLYYYSVGHKYIVKISSVRDELAALNDNLVRTKRSRCDVEKLVSDLTNMSISNFNAIRNEMIFELSEQFGQRENVFTKRSLELARKQAWYRSVALGKQRRKLLIWLLNATLYTLKKSSEMGTLFAFVPEVYINILPILLDTVLDFSFHDLSLQFDISDASEEISLAGAFLSEHSADPRIILASCKDSLLQALGTLICHEAGIRALEASPKRCQESLIQALLRPYENRAWGQSNWILLRCWLGDGFAYKDSRQPSIWQGCNDQLIMGLCRRRAKSETHTGLLHHVAPAYPSKYFQELIGQRLVENEPYATAFLNSVLSQLNWAFSEFILLLQEIQNTANRQESTVFDSKQFKICSMCFELTVSLMRCLEMVISVAPDIVQESSRTNSDLILNRTCQLISQVMSRVCVAPGCFQFIVDMCSPDLNSVTHFAIITAAIGILLALMKNEINEDQKPTKFFLFNVF
ncbi:E3 ubiquitin-protein ligase RNF123 isoform X2 [Episyrphus balteatus]|uniref:E3 ubiquitin-protein ligase RNF123 isoform X2 n=1 Tax=Episyrphus balteatus TaxID=286459 RepID=UPI0024864787|nr:E3 ubiquitin-protein ligase RNF123 isoform X2 [Episyrphus balteatus]